MKFVVYINGVRATKSDVERFLSDFKEGFVSIKKIDMTQSGAIAITCEG